MPARRGAPRKFPSVDKMSLGQPFVFYDRDKILALYKQETGKENVRSFGKRVAEWFLEAARKEGFDGMPTRHYGQTVKAGFVLWVPNILRVTRVAAVSVRRGGARGGVKRN